MKHTFLINKTDEQWQEQLTSEQYQVTRQKSTERPFSGEHCGLGKSGNYSCVCCDNLLFDFSSKFESGTGWPSYYQPATSSSIVLDVDYNLGYKREEVLCARCGSHLGHVFADSPTPTGLRYCINSVAIKFDPFS